METLSASLSISMNVTCPNDECGSWIDLLNERDTDGTNHDEEGYLSGQVFPERADWNDFECEEVTCSQCKTAFNVKSLEY